MPATIPAERRAPFLGLLGLLLGVTATLTSPGASAAPLDKTECVKLEAELAKVVEAGASADFQKGPAWGAANLSHERLAAVRRLIELNELLSFRCTPTLIQIRLKPDDGVEENDTPPLPTRPHARPAVGNPAVPAGATTAAVPPPKPKPRPKPKPAAKADDAFSPAAAAGSVPPLPQPAPGLPR